MGNSSKNNKCLANVPITLPMFDGNEEREVCEVLRSGWVVQGPKVAEFEKKFASFVNAPNAIAVSSCTTGLHLALRVMGIGPGDEVLLPSFTFVATANSVEYTGAKPVFIDIDPWTFNVNPVSVSVYLNKLKSAGQKLPKAIIPVSLFGLCADMESINEIARKYNLIVIEDAACGMGATRAGNHAGNEADMAVFSFHPRQAITTGEGGMIITKDNDIADKLRVMRNHGASESDIERHIAEGGSLLPEFNSLGYNYRMTDLQGAVGVAQMEKAREIFENRRRAAARYDYFLQDIKGIETPYLPDGYNHAYQSYVCMYKFNAMTGDRYINWDTIENWNTERNRLMKGLQEQGIAARQGTHAVHTLGYYKDKYGYEDHDFPYSYIADRLSIALPIFPQITSGQQGLVVDILNTIVRGLISIGGKKF
ncbi:MAG: DegT/DnrJ/EryC1/StrS family aminotransferase [candidate division Zixibacteria bacterium]